MSAPTRSNVPAQYMNQSIFQMISAAGSRADFNQRFDESSDSDQEDSENEVDRRIPQSSEKTMGSKKKKRLTCS